MGCVSFGGFESRRRRGVVLSVMQEPPEDGRQLRGVLEKEHGGVANLPGVGLECGEHRRFDVLFPHEARQMPG